MAKAEVSKRAGQYPHLTSALEALFENVKHGSTKGLQRVCHPLFTSFLLLFSLLATYFCLGKPRVCKNSGITFSPEPHPPLFRLQSHETLRHTSESPRSQGCEGWRCSHSDCRSRGRRTHGFWHRYSSHSQWRRHFYQGNFSESS
jgi:hypothetical protein